MTLITFANYTDTMPQRSTLQDVLNLIKKDEIVKNLTEMYRKTGERRYKEGAPLFAVACLFTGGKAKKNVTGMLGMSMVDFDHVPDDRMEALRLQVESDPHTLLSYVTMSGHGLRILFLYELDTTLTLEKQMQYYPMVFMAGNAYYARLTGLETDGKCKNVTRLSGVAHDEHAYYNETATPFTALFIAQEMRPMTDRRKAVKRKSREMTRLKNCYEKQIKPMMENEGVIYAPGSHNEYVMRTGYLLNKYGFSMPVAIEWAEQQFSDYDKTASVIESCYQKTEEFNTMPGGRAWKRRSERKEEPQQATVTDIQQYLKDNVRLRHNVVTNRTEYAWPDKDEWNPIDDRTVNTLWTGMSRQYKAFVADIHHVILSDFTPTFNPFKEYLDSLSATTDGSDGQDALHSLADTVKVKGNKADQERFRRYMTKWMVGMVAAWVNPKVVNNVILVLIGEQGCYKTTWFHYLLPPQLRNYFHTKTNASTMTRDDKLLLAQCALICCEELDTMNASELNQLKAAVTMLNVKERAAYAHFHEVRPHIASFCGTGNNEQFLTDPTGNRRWLPFKVEEIASPMDHPLPYDDIYREAYSLYLSGYRYWFNKDEIIELNSHNSNFETPRLESELVQLYFRKPGPNETGEFMSVARAMQLIGMNMQQKLSAVNLGRAFQEQGFKKVKYGGVRGYLVICRTGNEIQQKMKSMALEAHED